MSILHHQSPTETLHYIGIDKNEKHLIKVDVNLRSLYKRYKTSTCINTGGPENVPIINDYQWIQRLSTFLNSFT